MKKFVVLFVVALAAISVAVTAALAKPAKSTAGGDICVLLPDPKSSVRWETQDRPALVTAFKKAGVSYVITNADGDPQTGLISIFQAQASGPPWKFVEAKQVG